MHNEVRREHGSPAHSTVSGPSQRSCQCPAPPCTLHTRSAQGARSCPVQLQSARLLTWVHAFGRIILFGQNGDTKRSLGQYLYLSYNHLVTHGTVALLPEVDSLSSKVRVQRTQHTVQTLIPRVFSMRDWTLNQMLPLNALSSIFDIFNFYWYCNLKLPFSCSYPCTIRFSSGTTVD